MNTNSSTKNIDTALSKIYFDVKNPASFSTVDILWKAVNKSIAKDDVQSWLEKQDAYTLHRPIRKKFPRNRYYIDNIDVLWQADLADLTSLQSENSDFKYLITIIDCYSRYAWAIPLKTKSGVEITKAFEHLLKKQKRKPHNLQTDKGREFVNKTFKACLNKHNIHLYHTNNPDIKACFVERFNRTLKARMWRYFTHNSTHRYLEVLPALLQAYNNSRHRSIGMAPVDVNDANILDVWHNLYGHGLRKLRNLNKQMKFKVGDTVRISREKMHFEKGYEENWSTEVFTIKQCKQRHPYVYVIEDLDGEEIEGTFYEKELQRVRVNAKTMYNVNKILDTSGRGHRKKVLVSWKGYPAKFNTWIPATQLISKK